MFGTCLAVDDLNLFSKCTYIPRQKRWIVASFSPIFPAQCCFAGSKKILKKMSTSLLREKSCGRGGGDFSEGVDRLLAGIVGILDPLIEMQSFAIVNRDVLKHHHFTQLPYNKRIKLT